LLGDKLFSRPPVKLGLGSMTTKWAEQALSDAEIRQSRLLLKAAQLIIEDGVEVERAFEEVGLLFSDNIVILDDVPERKLHDALGKLNSMAGQKSQSIVLVKSSGLFATINESEISYPNLSFVDGSQTTIGMGKVIDTLDLNQFFTVHAPEEVRNLYRGFGPANLIYPSGYRIEESPLLAHNSPLKGSRNRSFLLDQILDILSIIQKPTKPSFWPKIFRSWAEAA